MSIKVVAKDINNIDNYRKHKPADEKYLKKRFGGEKATLIKELHAEQKIFMPRGQAV